MIARFTESPPLRILAVMAACALASIPAPVSAQAGDDPQALEERLGELTGSERLQALSLLTRHYRSNDPDRAVAYGEEALSLVSTHQQVEAEVTALNELGWALMELGRYDEALERVRQGQERGGAEGHLRGLARGMNNEGVIHRRRGDFGQALDGFQRSMGIYRILGDEAAVATSLNNLSVVLGFDLGDFDRALERQLQALEIRTRLGIPGALYQSYNSLGVINHNLGHDEEALDYLTDALEGWRSLNQPPRVAATLNNLADVYVTLGDLEAALSAQQESWAIREEISSASGVAFSMASVGNILMLLGRFDEAQERLDSALAIRVELGEQKNVAQNYLSLARLDRVSGRLAEAERRLLRAVEMAVDLSARDVERAAYEELALVREARGDYRGALAAYRSFDEVEDSLFSEARARRIDALEAELNADIARREIERLTAEAERAAAGTDRRNSRLLVGVLLATLAFLLYRRQVARRFRIGLESEVVARTADLSQANRRLEELSLTDTLTGLRNRRYFYQTVQSDISVSTRAYGAAQGEARPERADLVFYLLDLDNFKSVNDEFGHAAGDRVLEQTARLLEDTCRASDVVVRWGGEEFLIVSRQVDRAGAAVFAERVRQEVRTHVFRAGEGITLRLTCSLGFAAFPFLPAHAEAVTWEQLVALADEAAYVAKRSGRDAWVGVEANDAAVAWVATGDHVSLEDQFRRGWVRVVSSVEEESRALVWNDAAEGADPAEA